MAKHLIDSDMWDIPSFLDATPRHKLLAIFMTTKCDCAGIFRFNPKIASLMLGFNVTDQDIKDCPIDTKMIGEFLYWLKNFCKHQYGPLKSTCKPHHKVAEILFQHNLLQFVQIAPDFDFDAVKRLPKGLSFDSLSIGYQYPNDRHEEKDKDKEQEKDLLRKDDKSNTVPAREKKSAVPQDLTEMTAYGAEIGLQPEECAKAYDYYSSKGWKVGNVPMKDWKAALRNWKRNVDASPARQNPVSRPNGARQQFKGPLDHLSELGDMVRAQRSQNGPRMAEAEVVP